MQHVICAHYLTHYWSELAYQTTHIIIFIIIWSNLKISVSVLCVHGSLHRSPIEVRSTLRCNHIRTSAKMADRLTEINVADLPRLRDLYKPQVNVRKSCITLTTIETFIDWFEQNPTLTDVTFYCLNGDFSDGTFAVIVCARFSTIVSIRQNVPLFC